MTQPSLEESDLFSRYERAINKGYSYLRFLPRGPSVVDTVAPPDRLLSRAEKAHGASNYFSSFIY